VVSDGYHIYRVKRLLEARNVKVYGSPRPTAGAQNPALLRWLYLRQALGFLLWQLGIDISEGPMTHLVPLSKATIADAIGREEVRLRVGL
jgi:uncharacterized SAM-binding protein YcdF (DUF218 family)